MDRREALSTAASFAGLAAVSGLAVAQDAKPASTPVGHALLTAEQLGWDAGKGEFTLPKLPYSHNALEPHIDAMTMEIHHGKHHAAYVAGLNKALAELKKIRDGQGDAALVKHWSREVSFHGSGHVNHSLFWTNLAPAGKGGGGQPSGLLADAMTKHFGGFDKFSTHFKAAATQVEGGGWGWLAVEPTSGVLVIVQQEKQQDMLPTGVAPLLGIDVWEHAYYLKYQNKRADYVAAFFSVVDWAAVAERYRRATA